MTTIHGNLTKKTMHTGKVEAMTNALTTGKPETNRQETGGKRFG
jgi:hypothetical protein